jgi:SAM-dependent methyltransferase
MRGAVSSKGILYNSYRLLEPAISYVRRNLSYAWPTNWRAGAKAGYRRLFKSGVLFSTEDLGMASLCPDQKIDRILSLVLPKSVLDVGCGTGRTLLEIKRRGIAVIGVEASSAAIRASDCPDLVVRHDLRQPLDLNRRFDLVWCFEVAEHIHPNYVETFLDSLVRHSDTVAMSAAPPGQGGEGHFNEQPRCYWIAKLASRGYRLHKGWTDELRAVNEFYSDNMMVFTRSRSFVVGTDSATSLSLTEGPGPHWRHQN